jgi:hypothetical protein
MGATNVSHGVITIDVKDIRPAKVASFLQHEAAILPGNPGPAPEPVVQYKTTAQIEAEAQALEVAAEQLKTDAANVAPAA